MGGRLSLWLCASLDGSYLFLVAKSSGSLQSLGSEAWKRRFVLQKHCPAWTGWRNWRGDGEQPGVVDSGTEMAGFLCLFTNQGILSLFLSFRIFIMGIMIPAHLSLSPFGDDAICNSFYLLQITHPGYTQGYHRCEDRKEGLDGCA